MITDAGNSLADSILAAAKQKQSLATMKACDYANSDNKADQAAYQKYTEMADMLLKFHSDVCYSLHAVEREMSKRLEDKVVLDK